jgi:transposase InsO family protein
MSAAASPTTGKPYGIERICRLFETPRSTFYGHLKSVPTCSPPPERRGPKPTVSDDELLEHIVADLEASPFHGEGHRKVWARLKVIKNVRVSPKRVLRVMRENKLLSPHRTRQGQGKAHDGTIITSTPNVMWGTDGMRVQTVEDGWGWIFAGVEHWNAECVGFHVCKRGTRFAALEPIAMGLQKIFGSTAADIARGLQVRMDNGPQYISDHFLNQLRFWGITPSFAFVEEPQTNGVAERFNRTLKEQVINGRLFKNLEEVRRAVAVFVERYNAEWLVEKLGYLSPAQARANVTLSVAA